METNSYNSESQPQKMTFKNGEGAGLSITSYMSKDVAGTPKPIISETRLESVGGNKGFVDLVYPYASLKPLRDLLRNRVQADGSEESDLKWRNDLTKAVGDSMVELQVLLGQVVDDYQRIETLKEGDLLFFKKPELATVYIGGLPASDCQVGMAGPNVAIRIEKSLSPESI